MLVWSGIFHNGFHYDDFANIVNNRFVHDPGNILQFFHDPRAFSSAPESASWRPLLSTLWTADYWAARGPFPQIFLIDSFVWFVLQLIFLYTLFRLIPGGSNLSALFGAALIGLHPVSAESVNYIAQRGGIIAALGIEAGLALWIFWPRMLPARIDLKAQGVPKSKAHERRKELQPVVDVVWNAVRRFPAPYLFPVVLAMLASPEAGAFALILLAYVMLLDTGRTPRQVLPAGITCGLLWLVPLAATWRYASAIRPPVLLYWATQPLAAVRYFLTFFWPGHLAVDTGLQATSAVSPMALAGYAGLAALIWAAVTLSRNQAWRATGFGLWWFLLALVPDALTPQREVEAIPRMHVAAVGLAFAVTRAGALLLSRARQSEKTKIPATAGAIAAASVLLIALGYGTAERNKVWGSEEMLWHDAVEKNPVNGLALTRYADALSQFGADLTTAYGMMKEAAKVSPQDPSIELALARTANRLGLQAEADAHFRRAIAVRPEWADSYGAYAHWLLGQLRENEAADNAKKALALRFDNADARHTLFDIYIRHHDWANAQQLGAETLRLYPDDMDATRTVNVASVAEDELKQSEAEAAKRGSDGYLTLSVVYYKNGRFDDCIRAAKEALKINPNLAEAWSNIAAAYHEMGKIDESAEASKEVVRLNPNLLNAKQNLEVVLAEQAALHKQSGGDAQPVPAPQKNTPAQSKKKH